MGEFFCSVWLGLLDVIRSALNEGMTSPHLVAVEWNASRRRAMLLFSLPDLIQGWTQP
jgi:hypothetical protein